MSQKCCLLTSLGPGFSDPRHDDKRNAIHKQSVSVCAQQFEWGQVVRLTSLLQFAARNVSPISKQLALLRVADAVKVSFVLVRFSLLSP